MAQDIVYRTNALLVMELVFGAVVKSSPNEEHLIELRYYGALWGFPEC